MLRELLYCSVVVALKRSIAIQNENVEAIGVGCGLFLVLYSYVSDTHVVVLLDSVELCLYQGGCYWLIIG